MPQRPGDANPFLANKQPEIEMATPTQGTFSTGSAAGSSEFPVGFSLMLYGRPLTNPGIIGIHKLGEIIVRHDRLRYCHPPACNVCIWHNLLLLPVS